MSGNYQVRFLGGKGVVRPLTYPVLQFVNYNELIVAAEEKRKSGTQNLKQAAIQAAQFL